MGIDRPFSRSRNNFKKYLPLIIVLSAIKLIIHLVGNGNYGFHRDELLHLSVSEHLAWGYMEFPPMIAWIGKLAHFCFGYSISGVRFFSTLAGLAILILCCKIATEFGGKKYAVLLAGIAILAFLPFYRNQMLFQPVAFDQLFWTIGFYFLIRYLNSNDARFLVYIGITAGFGLLNKYTFVIWAAGATVALLSNQNARALRSKWLYISVAIALFMILPNLLWQFHHDFPMLLHLQKLKESQLDQIGPYEFLTDQIRFLFTFIFSIIGLIAMIGGSLKNYRPIAFSVLAIFALMWILDSKSYYFFAAYPVLFAAGAAATEKMLARYPKLNIAVAAVLILPVAYFVPKSIQLLPVNDYVTYANIKADSSGHYKLPNDYADMFGWEEQVAAVAKIYQSLSANEQKKCVILAGNYGEAGAVEILGDKYGLPDPVCANGSFWLWGYGNPDAETWITIGVSPKYVNKLFQEHALMKTITHPYAIAEENGVPVYLCHQPIIKLQSVWPMLEKKVFD